MRVRSLLKQHITFSLALTGATCTRAHLAETTEEVASPDISVLDQPDQPARLFRTALPTACHSIRSQCFSTWISPRHPRSRANSLPRPNSILKPKLHIRRRTTVRVRSAHSHSFSSSGLDMALSTLATPWLKSATSANCSLGVVVGAS